MTRIGIPRALLYYQYYPMWRTFFEELGVEAVLSPPTTQAQLSAGAARLVADTCLPVKAFIGHVLSLVDECDYLFIPVLRSVSEKAYNCAKFLGLPDMTRAVVPEAPPILDTEVDINLGEQPLYAAVYGLGRHFTRNPLRTRRAGRAAWARHQEYVKLMSEGKLTPPAAIARLMGEAPAESPPPPGNGRGPGLTIALIGHPYLLYDEHINHRLITRLERDGVRVLTPEMAPEAGKNNSLARLVGSAYWSYESEVVGAGGYFLEGGADGVIGVMAFGCGPDSLMMDIVRRHAAGLTSPPFMCLTLEEHTAEAGLVTRLEAFLDMIRHRSRRRSALCV